jgi:hypothetical protein
VRHRLVREIILAYEKLDEEHRQRRLAEDAKKIAGPNIHDAGNISTNLTEDKKSS